jgi:hypothetical protein
VTLEELDFLFREIEKKTENDIYGVYKLEPVQITRMHMGSRRVTRDVPTEVEESVFEWVKQSE